jgi:hypothetical protein
MTVYSTVNINWDQGRLAICSNMRLILHDYIQLCETFFMTYWQRNSLQIPKQALYPQILFICATIVLVTVHSRPTPPFPRILPDVVLMWLWLHCTLVFRCLSQWQTFCRFYLGISTCLIRIKFRTFSVLNIYANHLEGHGNSHWS